MPFPGLKPGKSILTATATQYIKSHHASQDFTFNFINITEKELYL